MQNKQLVRSSVACAVLKALILVTLIGCSPSTPDSPTENQGANALDVKIGAQSKGLLRLVKFTKTNGQMANVNGIKVYTMDCSVETIAVQDCAMTGFGIGGWNGSFEAIEAQKNADALDKFNPFGGAYAGHKQLAKGARMTFKTTLTFELTERGWRTEGRLPADKPFVVDFKAISDAQAEMDAMASYNRGIIKTAKGDLDGAIAEYSHVLELDPKNAVAYHYRGALRYDSHVFRPALVDFLKAIEVDSSTDVAEYSRFRVYLIRARLGDAEAATTELQKYLANRSAGKQGDWASQVGQFLAGQLADAALLAAATNADPKTQAGQLCEAYFYCGSKHLIAGDKTTAADCFNRCLATGGGDRVEYRSAAAELGFLKAKKN